MPRAGSCSLQSFDALQAAVIALCSDLSLLQLADLSLSAFNLLFRDSLANETHLRFGVLFLETNVVLLVNLRL